MSGLQRGGAAIVGAAESDLGQVGDGFNVIDLMAQGIARALDDRRPQPARCRRSVLRLDAGPHLGPVARRVSRDFSVLYRHDDPRRLVVRVSRRACAGGDPARPVPGRGDRLWQHAAQRRPTAGLGARDQPLRDAVPPVPAADRLCDGRLAPHAPVRHDPRADGRGRGRGAAMGAAQPGRLGEEAADASPRCSARG